MDDLGLLCCYNPGLYKAHCSSFLDHWPYQPFNHLFWIIHVFFHLCLFITYGDLLCTCSNHAIYFGESHFILWYFLNHRTNQCLNHLHFIMNASFHVFFGLPFPLHRFKNNVVIFLHNIQRSPWHVQTNTSTFQDFMVTSYNLLFFTPIITLYGTWSLLAHHSFVLTLSFQSLSSNHYDFSY